MDPEPLLTPITSDKSPIADETSTKSSDAISSPVSESTMECMFRGMSLTQSPPIQVMEREEDFDFEHERIPSDGCSPSQWSPVSNESLFSIHATHSYTHEHADLLAEHVLNSGKSMSFREHCSLMSGESDVDVSKVESPSKLDVTGSILDEPQKVVRWKTQVEHLADEGSPTRLKSSSLTNPTSSESSNQATAKPKKMCWSWCDCGSCKLPKWSCWNGCWTAISCSNCKPKKVRSSNSDETNDASKKPDMKSPIPWCCFKAKTCSSSSC